MTEDVSNSMIDPARHESLTYEVFIITFTCIALVFMLVYYLAPISPDVLQVLYIVNSLVITPILLFDFFRTLARAQHKTRYFLRTGWLDLLGSFPSFPLLRLLRLARLVIAWRTLRSTTPAEILLEARQRVAQSTFFVTAVMAILVLTAGSIAVVIVEADSRSANIVTGEDAVWWAIVTVATVGYGDFYPVTGMGRLIAVLLMIVGVSIFTVLTGYLSSTFLADRKSDRVAEEMTALRAELAALRSLIHEKHTGQ